MYPIVVVLLAGLADRAHPMLGGRTSNEAATIPNLGRLAHEGSCGLLYALGPGRAPSSDLAHWALLGYRQDEFPGRAVLEALGHARDVADGDVAAFATLRPAELRDGALWLTGRPRYGDDEEDAGALVAACDGLEIHGLRFSLDHLRRGEAILRLAGDADERVTDSDAIFPERHPVLRPQAVAPEAERTAAAVEEWTRRTIELLAKHPANEARTQRDLPALNVITLKWWGRRRAVPSFIERHGLRGTLIAEPPWLRGVAKMAGLETIEALETKDAASDLRTRLTLVGERLEKGDDFVYVHLGAIEAAGRTNDPRLRQERIEELDGELGRLPVGRAIVCVTGDHATPATPELIHSGDPVPFLLAGPGIRADAVRAFGELECAAGILGHLRGADVMPVLLNAADRPLLTGSRPTPFDGADGFPAILEPLRP